MGDPQAAISKAGQALAEADALLVSAGAGMGVDSGLPDFRGDQGFWKAYPAIARLGHSFAEMANPAWFDRDPTLAWAFYGHRLNLYRGATPHAGFTGLLAAGRRMPAGSFVLTSNVDGQFQRAGFDPQRIEECHGSIHHLQCSQGCNREIWSAEGVEVDLDEAAFKAREPLPRCPACGALARPNILMFGDWGWHGQRTEAQERRLMVWLREIREQALRLVIVEVGAGLAVPTIRYRSESYASQLGGVLIRVNLRDHQIPGPPHIGLSLGGADGVAAILEAAGFAAS